VNLSISMGMVYLDREVIRMNVNRRGFIAILLGGAGTVALGRYVYIDKGFGAKDSSNQEYTVEFVNKWLSDFYFQDVSEFHVSRYPNSDDFLLINGILVSSEDVIVKGSKR
jgi:hypothetical protein